MSKHEQNKKFLKKFGFGHDPPPFWKFQTEADFSSDGFPQGTVTSSFYSKGTYIQGNQRLLLI